MVFKMDSEGRISIMLLGDVPVKKGSKRTKNPLRSKSDLDIMRKRAENGQDIFTGEPIPPDALLPAKRKPKSRD